VIFLFSISNFLLIWVLTILLNLVATYRWYVILYYLGIKNITFFSLFKINFFARFYGQITSQIIGDFGAKTYLLKQNDIPLKTSLFSIFWDKSFELFMLFSVAVAALAITLFDLSEEMYWLVIPLSLFILFLSNHYSQYVTRLILWFKKGTTYQTITLSMRDRAIILLLTIAKYFLVVLRFLVILAICQIPLSFGKVFVGTAMAQLGILLGITPGGLGIVETGWAGVFSFFSIHSNKIPQFLIAQRIAILVVVISSYALIMIIGKVMKKSAKSNHIY